MVVTGVALGVLSAFAMTRVIRTLLFGITPTDTLTFVLVSLMLIVVSLIAQCACLTRRKWIWLMLRNE